MADQHVEDAFNSMLRADYIPLRDIAKLNLLADYYVDYYGFLSQILSENDQLIVGRRGTGKTTLLYRALVECMRLAGVVPLGGHSSRRSDPLRRPCRCPADNVRHRKKGHLRVKAIGFRSALWNSQRPPS
jgi:hypothetical protein